MGKLSIANEKQNVRNIICKVQGCKTRFFCQNRETNSPYWILMVNTQVTDIPFVLAFLENFKINKERETHIGDILIMLSLRIQSITPNAIMNQTKHIMGGNSSQINSENSKVPVSGGLPQQWHFFVLGEEYVDAFCVVQFTPDLYLLF